MIEVTSRAGQRIGVFGLGVSGLAAAEALTAGGAKVSAWDDDRSRIQEAARRNLPLIDLYHASWSKLDALVLAPGIPLTHPEPHAIVRMAEKARCDVIGDIELFAEARPAACVTAITGTNGKSTTTALIGHMLQTAGRAVAVGGNLGMPALALEPLTGDGHYVLELSSYQLDLTRTACFDIAVLLNLSPDHIDRHGSMDGYIAAKRRIFRERDAGSRTGRPVPPTAVVGADDPYCISIGNELAGRGYWRVVAVSGRKRVANGVGVENGVLYDDIEGAAAPVIDLREVPTLPGAHNWLNAAAAFASVRAAGLTADEAGAAMRDFPGLPHRQEIVAEIGRVAYVNDSKATNPDAAAMALGSYERIYWIAGGKPKPGGLGPVLDRLSHVEHAYLIGDAAEEFASLLTGKIPVTRSGDLATALAQAHGDAQTQAQDHAVVLLSPACASFDQWKNFEARGDAFREMVGKLAERETP